MTDPVRPCPRVRRLRLSANCTFAASFACYVVGRVSDPSAAIETALALGFLVLFPVGLVLSFQARRLEEAAQESEMPGDLRKRTGRFEWIGASLMVLALWLNFGSDFLPHPFDFVVLFVSAGCFWAGAWLQCRAQRQREPWEKPPIPERAGFTISCGQCGIDLKPGATQCHFCAWQLPPFAEVVKK